MATLNWWLAKCAERGSRRQRLDSNAIGVCDTVSNLQLARRHFLLLEKERVGGGRVEGGQRGSGGQSRRYLPKSGASLHKLGNITSETLNASVRILCEINPRLLVARTASLAMPYSYVLFQQNNHNFTRIHLQLAIETRKEWYWYQGVILIPRRSPHASHIWVGSHNYPWSSFGCPTEYRRLVRQCWWDSKPVQQGVDNVLLSGFILGKLKGAKSGVRTSPTPSPHRNVCTRYTEVNWKRP